MSEAMSILIAAIPSIIIALIGAGGFWGYLEYRDKEKRKEKSIKLEDISKDIKSMAAMLIQTNQEVSKLEQQVKELYNGQMQCAVKLTSLESNSELSTAYARDRLNHLSNKYMKLGYIPQEDIIPYKLLGQAYINAGGNTETKTKYLHCIEELDVVDDQGNRAPIK